MKKLLASLLLSIPLLVNAQSTIKIVIPFLPGSIGEFVLRNIETKIEPEFKSSIIIEHVPGAGGNIGTAKVANSNDGTMWMIGTDSLVTTNPHIYKNLGYKLEDIKPVMVIANWNSTLVCNTKLGVKTFDDFYAMAKTGKLSYGSAGVGSPSHLAMEELSAILNVNMTHIPYKGPPAVLQDLLGSQISCSMIPTFASMPFIKSGQIVAVVTSSERRSVNFPDVPTLKEVGIKNFQSNFKNVLFVNKNMSDENVKRIKTSLQTLLNNPETTSYLRSRELIVDDNKEDIAKILNRDFVRYGTLIRRLGITSE
jgi:tripartite-type tricarboxylate transporter receptor subunit TctC